MIIKGFLLFLICILLGIISLVSFIIVLVKQQDKKMRNRSLVVGALSLLLLIGSGIYLSIKTFYVVKNNTEEVADTFVAALAEHLSGRHGDSAFMDSLKSMQPTERVIPNQYYYYSGLRDYYRMPLVYPYSLVAIDDLDMGTIYDESKVENVFVSDEGSKSILGSITHFTFNEKYLLGRLQDRWDEFPPKYILLDLKTGAFEEFETEEQMTDLAKEKGFDVTREMITPKEYYWKF